MDGLAATAKAGDCARVDDPVPSACCQAVTTTISDWPRSASATVYDVPVTPSMLTHDAATHRCHCRSVRPAAFHWPLVAVSSAPTGAGSLPLISGTSVFTGALGRVSRKMPVPPASTRTIVPMINGNSQRRLFGAIGGGRVNVAAGPGYVGLRAALRDGVELHQVGPGRGVGRGDHGDVDGARRADPERDLARSRQLDPGLVGALQCARGSKRARTGRPVRLVMVNCVVPRPSPMVIVGGPVIANATGPDPLSDMPGCDGGPTKPGADRGGPGAKGSLPGSVGVDIFLTIPGSRSPAVTSAPRRARRRALQAGPLSRFTSAPPLQVESTRIRRSVRSGAC